MLPYLVEHMIGYYIWRIRSKELLGEYRYKVNLCNNDSIRWRPSGHLIASLVMYPIYWMSSDVEHFYKIRGMILRFTNGIKSGMRIPDYYKDWRKISIPIVTECGYVIQRRFIDCLNNIDYNGSFNSP